MKSFWCKIFFKKPACLLEFFSRTYDLLFLGVTACRIFFRQVCLAGIFFSEIVTPPPVISNGPSLSTSRHFGGENVISLVLARMS